MKRLTRMIPGVLLVLSLALTGCANPAGSGPRSGKLRVVATFSVLGDLVRNVAGDEVELVTLVGGDGDAHTFMPSPSDALALARADVVFENGVGFETWLDKLYTSSQSRGERVVVSKGLKLIEGSCDCCQKEKQAPHASSKEEHEELDPHIWSDVQNAIHMVGIIRDALAKHDPANADRYRANATAYLKQLEELDQWVQTQIATVPKANRKLVTSHDTFGYFARRYGFTVVGTALGSFSTEAADPSAADIAKLIKAIQREKVPAVFAENVQNPGLVQQLARQAGVKFAPPLFTDALGKEGSAGDTYIKMVRHNVTIITTNLKP